MKTPDDDIEGECIYLLLNVFFNVIEPQNWANDILAIAYNAARNNACRQVFLEKM